MSLIKASITANVRPTTMILGEDNRKAWSEMDVLIMHAYQILEEERCQQCGYYRWICRNEDPRMQVRIKEDDCYIAGEVRKHEKAHRDDDSGSTVRPDVYMTDGSPLHKLRSSYYEALAAEEAEEDDD